MLGILVTMLIALIAAVRGPSVFDRILAINMFGTKTVLLIAVSGFLTGQRRGQCFRGCERRRGIRPALQKLATSRSSATQLLPMSLA